MSRQKSILIDIGHPGHVHYFKHLIQFLKKGGHHVVVVARDKDVTINLLDAYKIDYHLRGKGRNSKLGKLLYMLWADLRVLGLALKNRSQVFLSFSSPYCAQVAWLLRKPHIAINDTEHTDKTHKIFTYPFSRLILTPKCYYHNLGKKHERFNGIMESIYLNEKYFRSDENVISDLGLGQKEYVILRFVSWQAHHDYGQQGLDFETKRALIKKLSARYKVLISSEDQLPEEFEPFKIKIKPEQMHTVLASASMFVGESGTMASECAYLGVPVVYINSLPLMGYLKQHQQFGLLKHFSSADGVLEYVNSLMNEDDLEETIKSKHHAMIAGFDNSTEALNSIIMRY